MIIAALDVGSNSLHLVVAETDHEKPYKVLASAKETVRLGRSAARESRLSPTAIERAVTAIKKFRAKADAFGAQEFIAAATSAVRDAVNRQTFIERAEREAGVHIDVLSGIEEARLIALAVSVRRRGLDRRRMLVIDIGGGSTELAVTQNEEPAALVSLKLGAVRMTEKLISTDPISDKQLRRLRGELRAVIEPRAAEIKKTGFEKCLGTSGTINALSFIATQRRIAARKGGRPRAGSGEVSISYQEVCALNQEFAGMSLNERLSIRGLNRARAEIIVAGGQILEAVMESVGVAELTVCDWALREGIIISHLMRRGATADSSAALIERDPSLRGALALAAHYRADMDHAHRAAYFSLQLFDDLRPLHRLGGEHRRLLIAAAILHDIGYLVSHTGHHKHSAYLIQNSEWTGFTAAELALIANIARYHRSSLPKPRHPYFAALPPEDRAVVRKLAALLRIADALDRDHSGNVRNVRGEILPASVRLATVCSRTDEVAQWRLEERVDLFSEEFGRPIELITEMANGSDPVSK
jgi:exopolyphosphatase / guanosine-5'-triphosphate,3'-diphosphate pyrophosphatase